MRMSVLWSIQLFPGHRSGAVRGYLQRRRLPGLARKPIVAGWAVFVLPGALVAEVAVFWGLSLRNVSRLAGSHLIPASRGDAAGKWKPSRRMCIDNMRIFGKLMDGTV